MNLFSRTELLIGKSGMEKLKRARVAVFGIGGVGGYAVEALVRSGIGRLELVDNDRVSPTNINRQIIALSETLGRYKTEAAAERARAINPECEVTCRNCFFTSETAESFDFSDYDYVIDAIDTLAGKIAIAKACQASGTPVVSCMGAGNKQDPTAFVPSRAPCGSCAAKTESKSSKWYILRKFPCRRRIRKRLRGKRARISLGFRAVSRLCRPWRG